MTPNYDLSEEEREKFYIMFYLEQIRLTHPEKLEEETEKAFKRYAELDKIIEQKRIEKRNKTFWGRILNFFGL